MLFETTTSCKQDHQSIQLKQNRLSKLADTYLTFQNENWCNQFYMCSRPLFKICIHIWKVDTIVCRTIPLISPQFYDIIA